MTNLKKRRIVTKLLNDPIANEPIIETKMYLLLIIAILFNYIVCMSNVPSLSHKQSLLTAHNNEIKLVQCAHGILPFISFHAKKYYFKIYLRMAIKI